MKRLTLFRHAKSSWADSGLDDFDRPLNDRGHAAAKRIGQEMDGQGMRFDCVLASQALRVHQTLDGVQEEYRFATEIRFEPRVYLASANELLALVRAFPESCESALLVGHNPGLHELLLDLTDRDEEGLRDRIRGKFPTAALASVELSAQSWSDVKLGTGKIVELILPRGLD